MITALGTTNTRSIKEWQCYLDTPQVIVDAVNILVEDILEDTDTSIEALQGVFNMLDVFQHYGFRDTECEHVAVEIINNYYLNQSDIHRFDYYANWNHNHPSYHRNARTICHRNSIPTS